MESRSSFPLACLLRYKAATLLDGYPPFFPGPNPPPHPLYSFPSCIHSLVASYETVEASGRRSLLSLIGGMLPENPIVHFMRHVQSVLRESSRACVACGYRLPDWTRGGYGWCGGSTCEEAFWSSPHTARIVHSFVHSRSHQLDLYLHVLIAAVGTERLQPMPVNVRWREKERAEWDWQRFKKRPQVRTAINLVPSLDELLLYDEDELAKQLNELHSCLLPLLAWTICTYSTSLHTIPALLTEDGQPLTAHHMVVSPQPTMSMGETEAYLAELARSLQLIKTAWMMDGGLPSLSFVSGGLWLLHAVLVNRGLLSEAMLDELSHIGQQSCSPIGYHGQFGQAVEAAQAQLADQRGRRQQQAVSGWSNSAHPACACVLMVAEETEEQMRERTVQSDDKRSATQWISRGRRQRWWQVRSILTIPAVHSADNKEEEEQATIASQEQYDERKWEGGRHAPTEPRSPERDRRSMDRHEWYGAVDRRREQLRGMQRWGRMQQPQRRLYDSDDTDDQHRGRDSEQDDDDDDDDDDNDNKRNEEDEEVEEEEDEEEDRNRETEQGTDGLEWDLQA